MKHLGKINTNYIVLQNISNKFEGVIGLFDMKYFKNVHFPILKLSYFSSSFDAFVWCAKCSSLMSYLWTFFYEKGPNAIIFHIMEVEHNFYFDKQVLRNSYIK
jgi:hypothetical protein